MIKGLTSEQVKQRAKQYGPNILAGKARANILVQFFQQFANFLTILLVIAALFSFFIGEMLDATLIFAIIFLNAAFGVYQENKAEQAVALLQKLTITTIRVKRDGVEKEIDSRELVPGDVFFIEEGVKIPADAKILQSYNLEINEAALTGESIPVVKNIHEEIFMGTVVSKGRGWVEVTFTGMKTKFGQIATELSSLQEGKTPLQKKLENLSEIIGVIGILISMAIFFLSSFQGHGYFASFLLAVSLAVAVVPEGLPAVMTITLAIGVKEMAKKKAIVRKMAAIEALGSVTLIATDKTGTLTENNMKVDEIYVDGKIFYAHHPPLINNHPFEKLIFNGVLCSTASLVYVHDHGSYQVLGDPTEGALLKLAKSVGHVPDILKKDWEVIDEVPFDQQLKRMSVVVKKDNEVLSFTKGAPEEILNISSHILLGNEIHVLTEQKKEEIYKVLDAWAKKGLRVLGFAYSKDTNLSKKPYKDLNNQIFIGLTAIHDPPRDEVKESLRKAFNAGIKVVMITGDNPRTAEAIGKSIGLMQEGDLILRGDQLETFTDEELMEKLPNVKIFARTTPFHKSRIVSLFQKMGEVVAVTGDGVNDAIALKQADVGTAMGLVGTDVARDAADMIITDDNFSTIVTAVEEGRNIVNNLRNSIKYLLAGNLNEAMTILVGLLLGLPPLLIPIQILFINLLSDGVPALVFAFSPRDKTIMQRKPNKLMRLLSSFDIAYIIFIGITGAMIVIASYFIFADGDQMVERAVVFATLTMIQSFIYFDLWVSHGSLRANYKRYLSKIFFFAFFLPIVSQFIITQVPFIAKLFEVSTLSLPIFLLLVLVCSTRMLATKAIKLLLHKLSVRHDVG